MKAQKSTKITKVKKSPLRQFIICVFCALCGKSAFRCQRIEVVSFFSKQSVGYQFFDNIKYSRSRFRIISAGFEQLVQIERFFSPVRKTS